MPGHHFCLKDNAINLPGKILKIYRLKEFRTHSFQSTLRIVAGKKIILDTVIPKAMFTKYLFAEENEFGVLLYPKLLFSPNKLSVNYSISVPLTDVGVGVSLETDCSGKLTIKKNN